MSNICHEIRVKKHESIGVVSFRRGKFRYQVMSLSPINITRKIRL